MGRAEDAIFGSEDESAKRHKEAAIALCAPLVSDALRLAAEAVEALARHNYPDIPGISRERVTYAGQDYVAWLLCKNPMDSGEFEQSYKDTIFLIGEGKLLIRTWIVRSFEESTAIYNAGKLPQLHNFAELTNETNYQNERTIRAVQSSLDHIIRLGVTPEPPTTKQPPRKGWRRIFGG